MYLRLSAWLSKHSRMRTLLVYGVVYSLPQLTTAALAILYVSKFTLNQYGVFGVLTATLALLSMVIDLGFSWAVMRNYYDIQDDPVRGRAYLGSMISGSGLVALMAAPVLALILYFTRTALGLEEIRRLLVVIVVLAALFERSSDLMGVICQAMERPGCFAIGRVAQAAASLVAGYLLVFVFDTGVMGGIIALMLGKLASALVYQWLLVTRLGVVLRKPDWPAVRSALSFGIPIMITRSAAWSRRVALRPALANVAPLAQVGVFSFASSFADIPSIVAPAIDMAITPVYFKMRVAQNAEFRDKVRVFAALYAAALFPVWLIFMLYARELIRLLAGPLYESAVPFCVVLMCASYVRTQSPFLARQISYLRQTWVLPLLTIPSGLFAICMVLTLGSRNGVMMASIAVLVAEMIVFLGMTATIRYLEHLDFPISTTLLLTLLLTGFAVWIALGEALPPYWPREWVKFGVAIATISAVLLRWGLPQRKFVLQLLRG